MTDALQRPEQDLSVQRDEDEERDSDEMEDEEDGVENVVASSAAP